MKSWTERGLEIFSALILAWIGWQIVSGWRRDALELPKVRAEFESYRAGMIKEVARVGAIAGGYHAEITKLRDDRGRAVSLRLCPPASAPGSANPAAAPGTDDPSAARRSIPTATAVPTGVDIGPDLELSARLADGLSAQVRGLTAYIATLPKQCLTAVP